MTGDPNVETTVIEAATPPGTAWVCRPCAQTERVPYRYPCDPWRYCRRCGCAMRIEEQLIALELYKQTHPPVASSTPPVAPAPRRAADNRAPGQTDRALLVDVPELAAMLGTGVNSIYGMHYKRLIPGHVAIGRRVFFNRNTVLNWISNRAPRPQGGR